MHHFMFRAAAETRGLRRGAIYCRARRGFTLVEVAIAAGVLALVITTSITTLQRAFLSLDTARNVTIAGQIMQSQMERLRLLDWGTVDAYPAGPTTLAIDTSFTSNAYIGNRFTLTRTVSLVRTAVKQVTFTITWRGYDGRSETRSYLSYYAQNGLYDYFYNSL